MALTAGMISVDCADPVRLAKFWTEAAGYDLRWQHEDRFLILGPASGDGATVLAEHAAPGPAWRVLADPEGNEFCVSAHG